MSDFQFDAYSPKEMAERVEKAGVTKGNLDFLSTLVLSLLAGIFIAFGALFYTLVIHDSNASQGFTRLLGGVVFSVGLILVIVAGAELFTGNNLIMMAYMNKKITFGKLARNWAIVFVGNFAGSLAIVYLVHLSGHWGTHNYMVGGRALLIALGKVQIPFLQAFARGILCNMLVCLAVWLCFSCRNVADKVLAIIFPIAAFVALGFEHCVANMFFIPAGLVLKNITAVTAAASTAIGKPVSVADLTWGAFFFRNLLPVTIGNIIGGAVIIALVYWFLYLRSGAIQRVRKLISKVPSWVEPDDSVSHALRTMKEKKQSCVLVGADGEAIGILSEADVASKVSVANLDPDSVPVKEIMTTPAISVEVNTPIYRIYKTMVDNGVKHLIVTEKNVQIGYISLNDILRKP
ncbi:MAG: formate/nitrite transporter family protein [Spirochaetaceae bacterium]|nr:MAG: formate/nitrite transporter family protein [Spirochaetaceae bacterium]